MRHLLICIVFLLIPGRLLPQLLINEFSSANVSGLTDENGQANDWIELYNNSSLEVNLAGYHLSDNASFLSKWSFPAVKIKPRSYLVVFASDKNRTALPVNYKTIINRGDTWQYLVPASEPPASWKNPGYSSASWQTGMSGFGYGDNDDSTVISNVLSVYIRKEFTLANIAEIKELVLSIDYDDGFIAYINGHEIARANVGTNVSVPYNQAASPSHEATMYSGGYPDNLVISNPQSFLIEGTNVIAIQGHNSGTSSGDLTLMPVLTTGRYVTDLFDVVPAFTRLKGNRLHTNFRISSEGEKIFLSRPDSLIIDTAGPTELLSNLSCGRDLAVPGKWTFFAVPTPSAPNITRSYSTINADTVMFSVKGGYYPGGLSLQLSTKAGSDSIFYTTDGSIPTISSARYTGPISLNGNTVVRAVSIKANMLPGGMVTNTYITTHHTLPVVCISTNPANLWDYYTGIYVMGPNASTVAPYQGANFWQDWEREAHVELYDTNGDKKLDQDIGIKIYGAYSRSRPQKSLALYARKQYGKGSFNYKVFRDKPIDKFEALVLRNSGNDWSLAYLRDGLTSTLVKDMDIDRQAYQPAVIYLNGEYWGIQDIREKINPDYIAENHGVNPASVNLLVSNATVLDGTNTSYNAITSYLNTYSLENDPDYLQVRNKLDINNYIQYQLTQLYIDNRDWPGNNIKFWNTDVPGNPWRWVIYDTDFGFGFKGSTAYTFNNIDYALVPDSPSGANRPWATLLFRKMMTNAGFRKEFANQYADRINRNFSPERVSFVIDSLRNIYLPEIDAHLARWNLTRANWDNQYNIIRNFAANRPVYAREHIRTEIGLGEMTDVQVDVNDPAAGKVKVNSIIPYRFPFTGKYFRDLPIKLTAVPAPGYRFVRWEMGTRTSQSVSIDYNMSGPGYFRAVFSSSRQTEIRVVINEINYKSAAGKDTKDWVELYNAGTSTVNLKGWILSDGSAADGYVIPNDYILTPSSYVVICHDLAAFRNICPTVENSIGDMTIGLSSTGDEINLYDPDGNLVDFLSYTIDKPWPVLIDPAGGSIELTNVLADNNNGINWKSTRTIGTPGAQNIRKTENVSTSSPETVFRVTCFPNPFKDYTTLMIESAISGKYRMEIFDARGKLLGTILDRTLDAGVHYVDWYGDAGDGSRLPGGIYIIRLSGEKHTINSRVAILR